MTDRVLVVLAAAATAGWCFAVGYAAYLLAWLVLAGKMLP